MTFPRRIQMQKWVPAERAINDAVQVVEGMGADVRLTDAVVCLGAARDRVADFVDGVEGLRTFPIQQRTVAHHALQQFITFVGEGHVDFPCTLTELSEAVTLFECALEDTA